MGIVVIGAAFVDIKGYPLDQYIPGGRNVGRVVQVHGGVGRNVVEDIANVELRPTFLSVVDDTGISDDVVRNLIRHKVDIRYIARSPEGLGTWLAVFDNDGDVIASISRRPDLSAIEKVLEEHGDEIFAAADSTGANLNWKKISDLYPAGAKIAHTGKNLYILEVSTGTNTGGNNSGGNTGGDNNGGGGNGDEELDEN